MAIAVDAIYENGVLKPKAPLNPPDKTEVHVTIEPAGEVARTFLVRRFREIRSRITESGARVLDWDRIAEEVAARRGGWREPK